MEPSTLSRLKACLYQYFSTSYKEENALQNTAAGKRVKCNWAPVKLRSSELTLATCDRLSHQTSPYNIRKHTERETAPDMIIIWKGDLVKPLLRHRHCHLRDSFWKLETSTNSLEHPNEFNHNYGAHRTRLPLRSPSLLHSPNINGVLLSR